MKFGVFTVSMPEYTPEEAVQLLKELGYDAVEWRVAEPVKEDVGEVPFDGRYWSKNLCTLDVNNIMEEAKRAKELTDKAGLETFGLTTYLNFDRYDEIVAVFEAAAEISCPRVRVGLASYNPKEATATYPELLENMRTALKKVEDLAKRTGVKAVVEIHMNTLIASPASAYRALEGFDPNYVGVIFDPGNMVNEGHEEYKKSFELLGDYIAHVHVKNGAWVPTGECTELGALKYQFAWKPLKEGQADLERLFEVMREVGYDASVSIEDFSNDSSTEDKLRDNIEYLHAMKKQAEA